MTRGAGATCARIHMAQGAEPGVRSGQHAEDVLTATSDRATFERMLVGRLSYAGCWIVLGLACFSCGTSDVEPKPAACELAGRETDLCRVAVRRHIACEAPTESEETLLGRCRSSLEDYPNRVAPCFVAELADCLAKGCGGDDKCYSDAIVANDPSVVDIESYRACADPVFGRETTATPTGCDDLTTGFLKACIERAHECSVLDDLCSSVVAMKQPFRGDAEACIDGSCTAMEGCLYAAMGRTKPD